ncbi:hypothetical protein ABZT03_04700 [Streptomyces sp. NPDC005574]|uniref:hypothetical protein n=1 Tax=Streptomyces sp. NPDC005574 TaxID=3156891 RepID=UPI0033B7CC5E
MTPRELVIRALPPFAGWLALAALALPDGSPLRAAAVVVFLTAGPGAAVVRIGAAAMGPDPAQGPADRPDADFERHSASLERLMLVVFVSVGVVLLTATALIAGHAFSGQRVLLTLTVLTTLAALCPPLRASPTARAPEGPAR